MGDNRKLVSAESLLLKKDRQETVKSPEYISIYSNNIQLMASVFDFSLTFGEMTDEVIGGQAVVNQKARVILSKEMTKVLWALLDTNIKSYESQFGEILLPQPTKSTAKKAALPPIAQGVARRK